MIGGLLAGVAEYPRKEVAVASEYTVVPRDIAISVLCAWSLVIEALNNEDWIGDEEVPEWLAETRRFVRGWAELVRGRRISFPVFVHLVNAVAETLIELRFGRKGLSLYAAMSRRNNRELASHIKVLVDKGARELEIISDHSGGISMGMIGGRSLEIAKKSLEKCIKYLKNKYY